MSCKSGNSYPSILDGGCWGRGLASKCHCGLEVVIYTSASKSNPGRPFFRCPTKQDDHLFKWVEYGVYEEVVEALPKISSIDSEIMKAKCEVAIEIEQLKTMIKEVKEEAMCSEREIKNWKRMIKCCLVCLGFIVIVIVVGMIMFGNTKEQKLVLGY
ncbi:T12C24.25 [Arabidopsis thaliana]|uniref:T12C24.25 n=1 Tax=Arabidopsis thaliana TaxID=3702 RepID=Q9LN75_ARATH|nr:T12C24.25 [Arabidopsis thaliana]